MMRLFPALLSLLLLAPALARDIPVRTTRDLRAALIAAQPGDTVKLAPGTYQGGIFHRGPHGTAEQPITITGADPANPPTIRGGADALHLVETSYVVLQDLVLDGMKDNGLNIDDGGSIVKPAHHVTLRHIAVRGNGGPGNRDGIKLSGLDDFTLDGCSVSDWGAGGSAIDMVGCHRGLIVNCTFSSTPAPGRGSPATGVQTKGGSADITIRRCHFRSAGDRAVNIGGSTGVGYFRPKLPDKEASEAKNIVVEGCTFTGSEAPIAFVGCDGATVRFNTFVHPRKWVVRILQESRGTPVVPCRNGEFRRNLIVYRTGLESAANVGGATQPESFRFAENFWYCEDAPERAAPELPTKEKDPVSGKDPMFVDPKKPAQGVRDESPAKGYGAHAFVEPAK
jgi:hypothetical protein